MEYFTPLQNLLNKTAAHPDKIYFHQPVNRRWQQYTWANVETQARCIASGLKAQGYKPGSRIGILSRNCAEWIIADLAIMMAGMVSIPIYATAGAKTIVHIIEHSDVKAIFVGKLDPTNAADKVIADNVLRIAFPYPTISAQIQWSDWLSVHTPLIDIHMPAIDDVATIVYTSGTTGVPKGVVLSYRNLATQAQHTAKIFNVTAEERSISYLPLAHIVERGLECASLYVGLEVFFIESPETFLEDLLYAKPTTFVSVPRLWSVFQAQVLAKVPQKKLDLLLRIPLVGRLIARKIRKALGWQHVTRFTSGAAPISISVLEWYQRLGVVISEGWGMTETVGLACGNVPFVKENLGTIGTPLACVEMKLSEDGEILVRGEAVFNEYYLDHESTAASFIDGWFRTGDVGQITAEGAFKITGRIKEKFKTAKGKYVAPVPIESLLSANLNIEQVCVMGSGLKQPVALIVLNDSCQRSNIELLQGLEDTLNSINDMVERHEILDYIMICSEQWSVENDLLTPTFKLKRNELEQHYATLLAKEFTGKILWEEDIR